jgi:hypothetical protein
MLTQSLKCTISSSTVSTHRAENFTHPKSLNVLTAMVFGTTIKESPTTTLIGTARMAQIAIEFNAEIRIKRHSLDN